MSVEKLKNLRSLVSKQYDTAIAAGDAFFYDSQVNIAKVDGVDNVVPWHVRNVPALLKKPKAASESQKESEKPQQNPVDVFAPPYVPNLLVQELEEFTVLLNKYCVLPHHFLLVTREFVKQELPPAPNMLAQAYRIIQAHPTETGSEMLGFFNCGPNSGASQPHCHFQFVELRPCAPGKPGIPIEALLDHIEKDGKEMEHVHMLPVPWRHFVVLLDPPADPSNLEDYLGTRFSQLLELMFATAREKEDLQHGLPQRPSFNVLLTSRTLHVVPRRTEHFDLIHAGWGRYADGGAQAAPYSGTLSVNALGYAGLLLTRHTDELEALCTDESERILQVLTHTGVAI
ncbi:ATP adenylyltransferase [Malassezia nana]|uniref:ATP adenylyltransferase n=1 Tax=Malassezia nana TaxID=180528 RepID=A0AAF0ESG7_9BASI|nr:ATP adenylyltransferase [Malassezia nana]